MTEGEYLRIVHKRPLRLGDWGDPTRFWQQTLRGSGYAVANDGRFGPKTQNATMALQAWANILLDGQADETTYRAAKSKKRTRRLATRIRHNLPGVRPKIIDARDGKAGFPQHPSRRWARRPASAIVAKLGHHSGGPGSFVADARFHVRSDYLTKGGAPAIAYHLGVDLDGTIFVFNDATSVTWHCDGGHNTDTLGVCLRGNTNAGSLTRAQRRSLAWLWKALSDGSLGYGYPKLPLASTVHKYVNATSCPGEPGEKLYREIAGGFFREKL